MQNSNEDQYRGHSLKRRAFLASTLKAAGATALITIPGISMAKGFDSDKKTYTVQDIINIILKEIPGAPFPKTVDTIKSGSAGQQVTGIVSTMFPTVKVINDAIGLGANFIVAHEPSFYNHTDDINWVQNNSVLKKKQELLQQHNIAIWRFHDQWHSYKPDGISYGVLKSAGWLDYYKTDKRLVQLPSISLKDLVSHLKSSLNIAHVRVIGNPDQSCKNILLIPGAAGGQIQIALAESEQPDVLIVGEVHEWETAEYIRDARMLGSNISLIVLGHSVSEEAGMQWFAEWLQPKIPDLKITHIASGDPFTWI
ncbi:MAG TPA: Nif3-like dinuclear metal center hexameric protein [Puia sp.]|nr:Nif3-like dinuclear metal center hexameric protein [Puia sp.]